MGDLGAYLARIGHAGPATPTLATLRALHALHPAAIAFEGLDPLLGREVRLDPASVARKLVGERRGGYCFEHNLLFASVLRSIGFSVETLGGRVIWATGPDGPPRPRTHMLLLVTLDGATWIADVGFGGYLADAPLRLQAGVAQTTPAGRFMLTEADGTWTLAAGVGDGWRGAYRFTLEPQAAADYEVANWYTSTHPASLFRNHLLMERLAPGLRAALLDRHLTLRHADGRVETSVLEDADALAATMDRVFGVTPPVDPAEIFARLPPAPPPGRCDAA